MMRFHSTASKVVIGSSPSYLQFRANAHNESTRRLAAQIAMEVNQLPPEERENAAAKAVGQMMRRSRVPGYAALVQQTTPEALNDAVQGLLRTNENLEDPDILY